MAGKISRRELLKGQFKKKRNLDHLNPKWPTEQVAKKIKQKLSDTPPITKLDEYSDSPPKLNIKSSKKRLSAVDWNEETAAHLLRRTLFAPTFAEIQSAANSTLQATVDQLLADQTLPESPGDWINEAAPEWRNLSEQEINDLVDLYFSRHDLLREWWMNMMSSPTLFSIREAMTLFWHDHFATGASKVFFPQAVYEQNNVLRENYLGNFKTMVRKISFGPAMMIWLDTIDSTKEAPNENFAREILELFTLDVDNYTQDDIVEAARAFTGYLTDGVETNYNYDGKTGTDKWDNHYFWTHDYTEKTFINQTGNWDGDDIIDIIFDQPALAYFICKKIYQWFLYEQIDEDFVQEMATVFRDNYNIKSVMEYLLTSEHFYDPVFHGAKIKNPLNIVQGGIRQFGLHDKVFPEYFLVGWQWFLGMMPLEPPNVAGWPGYRSWLNSITIPIRKIASVNLLDGEGWEDLGFRIDVMTIAQSTTDPNTAETLVQDLALLMLGSPMNDTLTNNLLTALLGGMLPGEWNINIAGAEDRLRDLFRYMMRLPEYQLA